MSKMICITEDGAFLASDNISAQDYLNITLSAQLNLFNNLVKQGAPKAALYDLYNEAASAFLATFAPDITLRPDLTEEAILKAENELIADKTASIQGDSAVRQSAKRIHDQMVKDGLVKPAKATEDGTVIPLNRKERRSVKQ